MTAANVMHFPPGAKRDTAIYDWCRSVWQAYGGARETIAALMKEHEIA